MTCVFYFYFVFIRTEVKPLRQMSVVIIFVKIHFHYKLCIRHIDGPSINQIYCLHPGESPGRALYCHKYAMIHEGSPPQDTTICAATDRVKTVFVSKANSVRVTIQPLIGEDDPPKFLLKYEGNKTCYYRIISFIAYSPVLSPVPTLYFHWGPTDDYWFRWWLDYCSLGH